jgi:hypothetical protein
MIVSLFQNKTRLGQYSVTAHVSRRGVHASKATWKSLCAAQNQLKVERRKHPSH